MEKNGGSFAFSLRGDGKKNGGMKTKSRCGISRQHPNVAGQVCFVRLSFCLCKMGPIISAVTVLGSKASISSKVPASHKSHEVLL